MIDEVPLDGIMVLVPNAFHFDLAKYCIEKGIDLFVEKPFTLSYADSKTLVELAEEHSIKGQVGYVNRFNPIFQRVKKLLDQNVIGEVSNYINRMTGGVILKRVAKDGEMIIVKVVDAFLTMVHTVLIYLPIFLVRDVKVQSSVLKKVFSTAVDDIVYSTLLHNDKIVGLNYINWSDSSVRKATNSIEIMGSKGKITANKQELSIFLTEENHELDLEKGWNQIYVTDENTDVPYYLRGEDFSRQLMEFSSLLNGEIDEADIITLYCERNRQAA